MGGIDGFEPKVVRSYRVFLWAALGLHLVLAGALVGVLVLPWPLDPEAERLGARQWVHLAASILLPVEVAISFAQVGLLRLGRTPIAYGLHQANLLANVAGIVLAGWALPLWWRWRRPEVQAYFDGP